MSWLERIFAKEENLPTLSPLYSQIDRALKDPRSNAKTVADLISKDVVISAKILQVVNSPAFGLRDRIHSISRAVAIMGTKEVSRIVLAISVMNAFQKDTKNQIDYNNFWLHCIGVSLTAKTICRYVPKGLIKDPEVVFVGGLIHDIGKLLEDQSVPNAFIEVLKNVDGKDMSFLDSEKRVLDCTHEAIGARLANSWNLPESLQLIIEYHNSPERLEQDNPYFPLVSIIHVADLLVKALDVGWSGDHLIPKLYAPSLDVLEIKFEHLESLAADLELEAYQLTKMLFSQ